ncbi:unnamed protein product, partial [Mesorhabditis belari]|uniref:7TM GPCR serpentine receptor class x (Srx) domain-containing protein n=1 Tax=Mesorhabditis belari TaxID=2138241 RepID=A0AAF3J2L0_9BILA
MSSESFENCLQVSIIIILGFFGLSAGILGIRCLRQTTIITGIVRNYCLCIVFFASIINGVHLFWGVPRAIWLSHMNLSILDNIFGFIAFGSVSVIYIAKPYIGWGVILVCTLLDTFTFASVRERRKKAKSTQIRVEQLRLRKEYTLILQMMCDNVTVIVDTTAVTVIINVLSNTSKMVSFICWTAAWMTACGMEGLWCIVFFRERRLQQLPPKQFVSTMT